MTDYQPYEMVRVKSDMEVFEMIPVGSHETGAEGTGWTRIGTFTMPGIDASINLKKVPGAFEGYAHFISVSYKQVRLVGVSGWWNDGTGAPDYMAFMDVVTSTDYQRMGPNVEFYTQGEAADVWKGQSVELNVGAGGVVGWGISDYGPNNTGVLTFNIYGK